MLHKFVEVSLTLVVRKLEARVQPLTERLGSDCRQDLTYAKPLEFLEQLPNTVTAK